MQKKISIIIPVYNGEKYLQTCIDSLLAQKFDINSLDIILLNDGSSDGSLRILNEYARKYPNTIRVIDKENSGAANTRNKGISTAKAKYLMLIDQDDYIDPTYCQTLYDAIKNTDSDVVQSGFKLTDVHGRVKQIIMPVETDFGKFLAIPAWAKIYRTDFLVKNKIMFFDNNIGEDSIFTIDVIIQTEKYGTIQYAGYCNVFDNASNVTNTLHKGLSESVKITRLLDALAVIIRNNPRQSQILQYNLLRTVAYYMLSYGRYAQPERFIKAHDEIFRWMKQNNSAQLSNKYVWRKPKGEVTTVHLSIFVYLVVDKLKLVRVFSRLYCKPVRSTNEREV